MLLPTTLTTIRPDTWDFVVACEPAPLGENWGSSKNREKRGGWNEGIKIWKKRGKRGERREGKLFSPPLPRPPSFFYYPQFSHKLAGSHATTLRSVSPFFVTRGTHTLFTISNTQMSVNGLFPWLLSFIL